ncbi:hypothetical protein ABPG75_008426 [Micractinium tetrahymenae]
MSRDDHASARSGQVGSSSSLLMLRSSSGSTFSQPGSPVAKEPTPADAKAVSRLAGQPEGTVGTAGSTEGAGCTPAVHRLPADGTAVTAPMPATMPVLAAAAAQAARPADCGEQTGPGAGDVKGSPGCCLAARISSLRAVEGVHAELLSTRGVREALVAHQPRAPPQTCSSSSGSAGSPCSVGRRPGGEHQPGAALLLCRRHCALQAPPAATSPGASMPGRAPGGLPRRGNAASGTAATAAAGWRLTADPWQGGAAAAGCAGGDMSRSVQPCAGAR